LLDGGRLESAGTDQEAAAASPEDKIPNGSLDKDWGVGSWIWQNEVYDKQTCRLWRTFSIPPKSDVAMAILRISVDNGYRLKLNGRELGTGSDWRSITEYDITRLLGPGRHVLAVEAFNDNREAGMLFGLKVQLSDGRTIEVPSNSDWKVVPTNEKNWDTRREAPSHWNHAVEVSAFLPRPDTLHERKPTMVVRVPPLRPVKVEFWQSFWFQFVLVAVLGLSLLLCLQLMARLAVHSKAQNLFDRERARIARDIHDELGARLTELALEGEVVKTELPEASPARPRLEALCEKARAVSGAMDELVWMVNSRRDTLRDFATFACKHAQRFLEATPIRCRLDVEPDLPDVALGLPLRRNLLLGVKEALNNAAKYSGATELFLRIHRRGPSLQVVVEDNGTGFDLESVDTTRNGLTNMTDRMKEVGGRCLIASSKGAGCRVEFQVPLPRPSKQPLAPPQLPPANSPPRPLAGKGMLTR
jgi:two-component sensor histidine kinase